MKKVIILFAVIVILPLFGIFQTIENIDYISSFSEDVAAIKKGNEWAFINKDGDIIINFRSDLVATIMNDGNYPIFKNNRCLIVENKNGILYFGYINKRGKTVIEPQFLNATPFNNNLAIVLELVKENVGKNELLGKNVVYYKYFEVTIDTDGTVKDYLTEKGVNITLDKKFLTKPPKIKSHQVSGNIIAIKDKNGKWIIKKIDDNKS